MEAIPKLNSSGDLFAWLISRLAGAASYGALTRTLIIISLACVTIFLFFKALNAVLENVLKLGSALKDLGIHTRLSPGAREEIRRRRQFCRILDSDLATLAKAENWNDQYLSELEAEVEAEGSYYLTRLHRMTRWKSKGIRRVSSLISAIENSSENRILVVGDPGSGKSVALRHLAGVYARRGYTSKSPTAVIPLYINLREFATPVDDLSGAAMKAFVLDNVRRGDSDTAEYVNEKWETFKGQGNWLFLFDSFDEIPAVLHAPSDGKAIHLYAEAIRHFLDAAPSCRAVLASREFKGPRDLPWHRFRILQLNDSRQEELIDCSFLPPEKRNAVKQHVAISETGTFRNPMLLSLLCRFLKLHGAPPKTDFDLLSEHLRSLARRDVEHLKTHFGLTPQQAFDAATILAKVIAETPSLGLAPSTADLEVACAADFPSFVPARVISALVDLKIGRVDVPSASSGERRFAFAHRRYQEILYVSYLREHGVSKRPRKFLTEPRLREYAVTYLQSQNIEDIAPLLDDATALLTRAASQEAKINCEAPVGDRLGYYGWTGNQVEHVLQLFKEGLAGRVTEIPRHFQVAVAHLVEERAIVGDANDLYLAVSFSGMLEESEATKILNVALDQHVSMLDDVVTRNIAYRGLVPESLKKRFLMGLSDSTLTSRTKVELFRLEAMAARLPSSSGASIVFRRSMRLRAALVWPRRLMSLVIWPLDKLTPWQTPGLPPASLAAASAPAIAGACMLFLTKGAIFPNVHWGSSLQEPLVMLLFAAISAAGLLVTVQLLYRVNPDPLTIRTFWTSLSSFPRRLMDDFDWKALGIVMAALVEVIVVPGGIVQLIARAFGHSVSGLLLYAASSGVAIVSASLIGVGIFLRQRISSSNRIARILKLSKQVLKTEPLAIALQAESCRELYLWLNAYPQVLGATPSLKRSLLRLLRDDWALETFNGGPTFPLIDALNGGYGPIARSGCTEYLLRSIRDVPLTDV
jgi:hypothetical protein